MHIAFPRLLPAVMSIPPTILENTSMFEDYEETQSSSKQNHNHTFTCHYGHAGETGCRLNYPKNEKETMYPIQLIPTYDTATSKGKQKKCQFYHDYS